MAVDARGNVLYGDPLACVVRERYHDSGRSTIVAGNGRHCTLVPGTAWDVALEREPAQVLAVDGHGDLFIADPDGARVWAVHAGNGIITIVAGNGQWCGAWSRCGDGGPATQAAVSIRGIAVDGQGDVFMSIAGRVVEVHAGTDRTTTVAGNGTACAVTARCGDCGLAAARAALTPGALALDGQGHLFIADSCGARLRMVDLRTGIITTAV